MHYTIKETERVREVEGDEEKKVINKIPILFASTMQRQVVCIIIFHVITICHE